jgi:hypothetical protein
MPDVSLLAGPYIPPLAKRGERMFCLYRDCDVIITTWTDARIPWPRCRRPESSAGSGLLITEELVRAIKTESAVALKHCFGIGTKAVWNWRKAFGVAHWGNEGSKRLKQEIDAKALVALQAIRMKKKLGV